MPDYTGTAFSWDRTYQGKDAEDDGPAAHGTCPRSRRYLRSSPVDNLVVWRNGGSGEESELRTPVPPAGGSASIPAGLANYRRVKQRNAFRHAQWSRHSRLTILQQTAGRLRHRSDPSLTVKLQ